MLAVASTPARRSGSVRRAQPAAALCGCADAAFLTQYCVTCHNARVKSGGLALDALDPANVDGHAETWEKVVRKVRTGMMPPDGAPKPAAGGARRVRGGARERRSIARRRAASIRRAGAASAESHRVRQRRSRPAGARRGRQRAAAARRLGRRIRQHRRRARRLAGADRRLRRGRGARSAAWRSAIRRSASIASPIAVPGDLAQDAHIDGLPLGTRGGIVVRHTFPLDAEYDLQVGAGAAARASAGRGGGGRRAATICTSTIDGAARHAAGTRRDAAAASTAGPHTIAAALDGAQRSRRGRRRLRRRRRARPGITQVTIAGPFNADRARRHAKPPAAARLHAGARRPRRPRARRRS